ncbi:peroxiredoxin-5, mitochondrial-like [Ruditapes philippinarum]|uniref:peroxiredoxin-5, mitochondrial-like n=1 Tax=Ruditapes philippinarum TaxID=129788 RepID=UPI00295B3E58|nr:peroxiredoxin-5, mitochondrial-like [Ruditapes philippinarum]
MNTRLVSQAIRFVSQRAFTRGFRTGQAAVMAPIKVGDQIPNVDLYSGNPGNKVNTLDAFGKGKHVIVAVVGAFTPTCQVDHMPTFIADADKIKAKGVDSINCISVNDPFVMEAFGEALGAKDKVKFLADTTAEFTKAVDLAFDLTGPLGNVRSHRYAMVVEDGKVKALNVESDSTKAACSKSSDVLSLL